MNYLAKETPISIVKHATIDVVVECDIHPIHTKYEKTLLKYFDNDDFFEYGKIELVSYYYNISTIKYKFDSGWVELGSHPYESEDKINEVVERFMRDNGGYDTVKA